jgi:hypothetical protein
MMTIAAAIKENPNSHSSIAPESGNILWCLWLLDSDKSLEAA